MPLTTNHPYYSVWAGMKARCHNPKFRQYHRYGGRGITVCKDWLLPFGIGFANFVTDMGYRPVKYTIERIDNDKGYYPDNCKWASRQEQSRNKSDTRIVIADGITYKACELAQISGLKTDTIIERGEHGLTYQELIDPKKRIFKEGLLFGGKANGVRQKSKTHCPKGHEYTASNTSISKQGWRRCKTCRRKRPDGTLYRHA